MGTILSILGMVAAVLMIRYRQLIGDELGDAYWMRYVGGVYNFVMILGVMLFFICIAKITGTTHIIFGWVRFLVPGQNIVPE